ALPDRAAGHRPQGQSRDAPPEGSPEVDSLLCSWSSRLFEPMTMGCLFGAIAARRHTAPSSSAPSGAIDEQECAAKALAGLHVGEILLAHEPGQRFANRQQQRLRRSPAPQRLQRQAIALATVLS